MAITLTSLNEQLVRQNDTLGDVRTHIKAMLKIEQDQLQSMKDAKGDELVAERKAQRASKPVKSASKPMGFGSGFMEGLGVTPVRQFMANALGSMFGGALAGSIGLLAGNLIKKGSIAALVYNFADDAIISTFKLLEDQGIEIDLTEEQKQKVADRASKGLTAYILTGLVSKNPYVKLATAIATAYSDKVFESIKLMFGIKTDSKTGKADINIPGIGDIDLNNSELQSSLTGIGATLTLVTVGLLNKIRKYLVNAKIPLPDDADINNKFKLSFGGSSLAGGQRGATAFTRRVTMDDVKNGLKTKGGATAPRKRVTMDDVKNGLKTKGGAPAFTRRVTMDDVKNGLKTKGGAPAKVGQMTKLNNPPDLSGGAKGAEFSGKPWYKRVQNFNKMAKILTPIGIGIDAYRINEILEDDNLTSDEKGNRIISIISGLGLGIAGGALFGTALGTVLGPGWGNVIGGVVGGSLMALGGEALVYKALSDYVMGKDNHDQYKKMADDYSKIMGPGGQPMPGYQWGAGGIEKIQGASGGYELMMGPSWGFDTGNIEKTLTHPNTSLSGFRNLAAADTATTSKRTQQYHGVGSGRVGRGFVAMGDELSILDAIAHRRDIMRENNYIGHVGDNNTVNNSRSVTHAHSTPTIDANNGGSLFSNIGN